MTALTESRVARITGISVDQLRRFADFAEQQARELIAAGVPEAEAIRRATDETVAVAKACGVAL